MPPIQPSKPTAFEEDLIYVADQAWDQAVADYYYPALAKPKFIFDPTCNTGFFIDTTEWRVTLNLLQVPTFASNEDTGQFIRGISQHEIGHYDLCPYDGLTSACLLSAAAKKVPNYFAPLILNIFSDLVIDTMLHQKYQDLTEWRLKESIKDILAHDPASTQMVDFSDTWKLLVKTYELLWKVNLNLHQVDTSSVQARALRLAQIVAHKLLDKYTWPAKVTKIAELLKPTLEQDFTMQVGQRTAANARRTAAGEGQEAGVAGEVHLQGPTDYARQFGDPAEVKSREKVQGKPPTPKEGDAERFARNRSFREFGSPARMAGLIRDGSTLAAWYRARAKGLISIRTYEQKAGGTTPAYPNNWRLGDPLEELDVILSAQVSPVLIPNITTRKWVLKQGPTALIEKAPPDLLIVLDSSGSMNWHIDVKREEGRGEYDIAALAAFAALHYVMTQGCKVASLNFSDIALACEWTNDYTKVEANILQYQGGGTELPIKALQKLVHQAERRVFVLIITDLGIHNYKRAFNTFTTLAEEGNLVTGFFIGGDPDEFANEPRFVELRERGISFYPVKNIKDLVGLVIGEIQKFF